MKKFNLKDIELVRLTNKQLDDLTNFDCGDSEMNRFFHEEAFNEQEMGMNITILLYIKNELAAACSICCDAITLNTKEKEDAGIDVPYAKVPAIKVARLGRSIKYKDFKLGKFLVEYIKNRAYELNEDTVGVRFLTLDAYPKRVKYYQEELGFVLNMKAGKPKNEHSPISMRADIFKNQ